MGATLSTEHLLALLASPDPRQRDEVAYVQLAQRVATGVEDGKLALIGEEGVALLRHDQIQARTFGVLALAEAVSRDGVTNELPTSMVHRWQNRFCQWYLAEEDLRGWDPTLGWLHAVAHGADAIAAFARSGHSTRAGLAMLLSAARDRVLTSGDTTLFANAEQDRVGFAMALVLVRPELTEDAAIAWLAPVRAAFSAAESGPVPAWVSNTGNTLRSVYVFAHRGVRAPEEDGALLRMPHRHAVTDALAQTLGETFAYIADPRWRARRRPRRAPLGIPGAVASVHPGLPLVGYESDKHLADATAADWTTLGRVWVRSSCRWL